MKKTLTLLLAFVMVASLFVGTAFAAGISISAGNATATAVGDEVTVDINMTANSGLGGLQIKLNYDEAALELTDFVANSTFAAEGICDAYAGSKMMTFVCMDSTDYTGTIATATFKVLAAGEHAVSIQVNECYDGAEEDVTPSVSNGKVSLAAPVEPTPTTPVEPTPTTPAEPTPTTPVEPTPTTPAEPSTQPTTPVTPADPSESPKTGNGALVAMSIAVLVLAAAAVVIVTSKKKA